MTNKPRRYNTLSSYLKSRYSGPAQKVIVNAGLTCPTRDGRKGTGGCIYCSPKSLLSYSYEGGDTVTEQIERGIAHVRNMRSGPRAEKFIAFFQTNTSTYGDIKVLRALYSEAAAHPSVVALCVSTRPDALGTEVLDLLEELSKEVDLWLELGLQSSNNATLRRIGRGHTAEDFKEASIRATNRGINIVAHVIAGLPGEGREDFLNTVRFVADMALWGIKFHQLDIVKGAPIEELYNKGEITLLSLEEYTSIVVESLEILPPEMVVHRLLGRTHKDDLVAPLWSLKARGVRAGIDKVLEERDTCQGARYIREGAKPPLIEEGKE